VKHGSPKRRCPSPKGWAAPTEFWLATVDRNMSFRRLVGVAKLRWRIDRRNVVMRGGILSRSEIRKP
jgi:hypothetical protein